MTTKQTATDRRLEEQAGCAANAFQYHEIVERSRVVTDLGLYATWRCGRLNYGTYAFWITVFPGTLIVTGDVGELIVQRTNNMIAWSRSAVNSVGYFAEKVPHSIPTKEYSSEEFDEWIEQERDDATADEDSDRLQEIAELLDTIHDTSDSHEVYEAIYDSPLYGGEMPRLTTWNSNFMWCRECVKWFLAHVDDDGLIIAPPTEGATP